MKWGDKVIVCAYVYIFFIKAVCVLFFRDV